jgi:hypothetical protein
MSPGISLARQAGGLPPGHPAGGPGAHLGPVMPIAGPLKGRHATLGCWVVDWTSRAASVRPGASWGRFSGQGAWNGPGQGINPTPGPKC